MVILILMLSKLLLSIDLFSECLYQDLSLIFVEPFYQSLELAHHLGISAFAPVSQFS